MEVITRGDVSGVTLLWQRGPGWVLTVVCKAVFDLKPGEAALVSDPAEPSERDETWEPPFAGSLCAVNDRVPLKPRVDVIVTGHAHAPGGVPVRSLQTRVAIGAIDKTIEVLADRYFDRSGLLVEGAPFARLPLVYELAAGGPGTWNPAGLPVGTLDGLGHMPLPNLVPPGLPPPTPDAPFVAPIGYGPIPADWPSRLEKLGRRSARGLPANWHGAEIAEDFPRAYFNAAPDDQQLAALPEDLTMTLENLIPGHAVLTCWLPSICPTILCETALGTSSVVPSIDTLHIDTDASRCSVVWRGHLPRRDPSEEMRVLISLDAPRTRVRMGVTGEHARVTGEHVRVMPPPLPPGAIARPEPPTFAGTGEHARVVMPPPLPGGMPRPEPPTFSGTGEHPRVIPPPLPPGAIPPPPTFSGTGEHPRVSLSKQGVSEREPPTFGVTGEHARVQLPTAPFLPEPSGFGGSEPPRAIPPARKSEPTALYQMGEPPRAIPAARKSEPTALYQTSDLSRATSRDRKSEPTALYQAGDLTRATSGMAVPPPLSQAPGMVTPPSSPQAVPDRKSQPTGVFPASAVDLARLSEIELEADPESEPEGAFAFASRMAESEPERAESEPEGDLFDEANYNPRDTIAPGLINPVGLPFPVPMPRPTPDPEAEAWGSGAGQKTGMFPWGLPPASRPAPAPIVPAAVEVGQPISHAAPSIPVPTPRPSRSGQTLPPAPMSSPVLLPSSSELRAPPVSAALRAEVSVPVAPPVVNATLVGNETGNSGTTDALWGTGPSAARGETIGMALSSGALALAEPRYDGGFVDEPTPAPSPARSPLLLLWFDADSVVRIRRAPQWKALLDELEKHPLDRDLESEGGTREPWELEDRRDIFEICARGRTASGRGCEDALSAAKGKAGKVVPPVVLVEGELEIQLDELESLKAAATTVAPLVSAPDENLRAALEAADTFLRRPGLSAAPAVCEGLQMRLREGFLRDKRALPPDYVERQVERTLLTGRHYQKRDVFGGPFFRATLRVTGEKDPLVVYLPETVHRKVPMFRRFPVRLIVDVHPQQDPYETRPLALRVLAVARSA